jgi:hypothetical protein
MSALKAFCSEWPYAVLLVLHSTLLTVSDVIVVPCCMNSTISTPFLSKKTIAISFLAENVFKHLGLFGKCVYIHCFDSSLVSTFTYKTQVLSSVTRTM